MKLNNYLLILIALIPAMAGTLHAHEWEIHEIGRASSYNHSELAFDPSGNPCVAYVNGGSVFYSSYQDNTWITEEIDEIGASTSIGKDIALVFSSEGSPIIAYYDQALDTLKIAEYISESWVIQVVDNLNWAEHALSMRFDRNGILSISYFDLQGGLKFAQRINALWIIESIDPGNRAGEYNSLSFGSNNEPSIAYFKRGTKSLHFARKEGGTWSTSVIDSDGLTAGEYCSLEYSDDGIASVSYYVGNPYFELRFAKYIESSWVIQTVDSAGSVGQHTSLDYTPNNHPGITYIDNINKDLKYAVYDGAGWAITTVVSNDQIGYGSSLSFSPDNRPAISYLDDTRDRVRYAILETTDTDYDLLPDDWEISQFGTLSESPSGDFDDDGWSNYGEFNTETFAYDPTSRLNVQLVRESSGYRLLYSPKSLNARLVWQWSSDLSQWYNSPYVFNFESTLSGMQSTLLTLEGEREFFKVSIQGK